MVFALRGARRTDRATYGSGLPRLALGALALLQAACGCSEESGDERLAALVRARDMAADASVWPTPDWHGARQTLAPFVAGAEAEGEDLVRAAFVELADLQPEKAVGFLDRAEQKIPGDPRLLWGRYLVHRASYENEEALAALLAIRAEFPEEIATHLAIVMVLRDVEPARAEEECRSFLARPRSVTGAWRKSALYQMYGLLTQSGRGAEGAPYMAEYNQMDAQGIENPSPPAHQLGTLGAIAPHAWTKSAFSVPTAQRVGPPRPIGPPANGALARRLDRGTWPHDRGKETATPPENLMTWEPGPLSLLCWDETGLRVRLASGGGEWTTLLDRPVLDAIAFDRANFGPDLKSQKLEKVRGDRDLDLLVLLLATDGGAELRLLENRDGAWTLEDEPIASLAEAPHGMWTVDYDHDGDLDLVLAARTGARLLRNDGFEFDAERAAEQTVSVRSTKPDAPATRAGSMTEVSETIPFPPGDWNVLIEDVDGDNDVDLLLVDRAGGRVRFLDDRRGGSFVEAPEKIPAVSGALVLCEDFDGSSWPDLVALGADVRVHRQSISGAWHAPLVWKLPAGSNGGSNGPVGPPIAVDWDLDGTTDLFWPTATGVAGLLAPGFESGGVPVVLDGAFAAPCAEASLLALDAEDDHDLDLLHRSSAGLVLFPSEDGRKGMRVDLMGVKDNSRGVGAVVELVQGARYRRIYWTGEDRLLAMGDGETIGMLRATWPNGVHQGHFDLPLGTDTCLWQRAGLSGSCPFLYSWNGTTFEFVSDVLGITPLGLPMAPGMLVPPDHDEYVLVRGEQLVPRDGEYVLQLTEELREVTYLDRVRLDVVDHPAGVEVFPNERFSFPPFPEPHTHTVRDPLRPLAAVEVGGDRDWRAELAADDHVLAAPFEPLPGQYQGLATPHTLELSFDARAFRQAKKLRLLLNGWFFWTDASVNVAAARHPAHEFVPPLLSVPDGEGSWRETGPPIGFPAGKLKTMVVDVTELVNREDPRLRLFSTLRIYWDSIRLAVDDDDAPLVVTSLEPRSANLWERGFSRGHLKHEEFGLEWFDWDELETEPRWNQHPGLYTRLGETQPLLSAVDDVFVVMGAGDALTLRFDASQAPPLAEGWERDFLLFLDGWAKDRDPNTLEALYVEPLPFHGMSGYPYGAEESFPDTELHRAWRREYQTRPAKRWIESLAPPGPALSAAAYHQPDPDE